MRYRPSWLNERAPNNVILPDDAIIKARSDIHEIKPLAISQISCLIKNQYSPKEQRLPDKIYRRPLGILPNIGGNNSPSEKKIAQRNREEKAGKTNTDRVSFPVISNIGCLTGRTEGEIPKKSRRNYPAYSRGQKHFLQHRTPTPVLQKSRDCRKEITKSSIIVPDSRELDYKWVPSKWQCFNHDTRLSSRNIP